MSDVCPYFSYVSGICLMFVRVSHVFQVYVLCVSVPALGVSFIVSMRVITFASTHRPLFVKKKLC